MFLVLSYKKSELLKRFSVKVSCFVFNTCINLTLIKIDNKLRNIKIFFVKKIDDVFVTNLILL